MDITITIKCPDLTLAAATLAKAIMGAKSDAETARPAAANPAPAPVTTAPAAVDPVHVVPAAPVSPAPAPAAVPVSAAPSPVTTAAPAAPAPVSQAPQITLEQIGRAGADLINANPGALPQLMGLLQKYGVQSAQQLKPDQIGTFATELRGLGARI